MGSGTQTGLNIASSGHPPILIRHDEENGRCLTTTAAISPARALIRIPVTIPSHVGPTAHLASLTNSLENFTYH